uniref:Tc1-like transposase DDE domain-containing protein n=1 Tax=Hucho hucho TaxID=62062 RepID=A0A4W5K3C9_9TELE
MRISYLSALLIASSEGQNVYFTQRFPQTANSFDLDNDPKHASRLYKCFLTKQESDGVLHQMTWPPQSPDLNPIEMVWDELDHRVKEKQPTSAQHMWDLLQDCWKSISGKAG